MGLLLRGGGVSLQNHQKLQAILRITSLNHHIPKHSMGRLYIYQCMSFLHFFGINVGIKIWLVVSTHLKNISQNWKSSPNSGENRTCMKPPPRNRPTIHEECLGTRICFFGSNSLEVSLSSMGCKRITIKVISCGQNVCVFGTQTHNVYHLHLSWTSNEWVTKKYIGTSMDYSGSGDRW